MDDAGRVGVTEAPADFDRDAEHVLHGKRPLANPAGQGLAVVVGHGEVKPAAGSLSDVVDGADVGVIESRRRPRFGEEPLLRAFIRHQVGRQEFERHETAQPRVFGFVDHAHPAAADFADDSIRADLFGAGRRLLRIAKRLRRQPLHRQIEHALRPLVRHQQLFYFLIKRGVALALALHPVRALWRGTVDGSVEYRRDAFPGRLRGHREMQCVPNCRPSTALCKARRELSSSPAGPSEPSRPADRRFPFR